MRSETVQNKKENNKYITLKEMLDMLAIAHTNYASRPVLFASGHRKFMANSVALSVHGDEYKLTFDGNDESIGSNDMINMLKKVYGLYGDRPVKVMVDDVWNVVDFAFQTSGRDYCFVCEKAD